MSTILTDDDRKKVFLEACGKNQFSGFDEALMILTEAAVLAKLAQQEPVAWHTEDHLTDRSATTYSKEAMHRWQGKGWPVTPLYTHPAPQQADRQRVPANKAKNEFRRVIQRAITLGSEAAQFLRCWNEGNWDGCREFDFEPALPYEIEDQDDRQRVPDGWKLVPVVPTSKMLGAADREHAARDLVSIALISYQAMLAAAPEVPSQASAVDERVEHRAAFDDMRSAVRFAPSSAYWSAKLREFFGPDARSGIDALEKQLREARAALAQRGGAA